MLRTLATVWLLHVAALLTPGANVLVVSHLAAGGDRRAAACAAAGVAIGAGIWSSAAAFGVTALFAEVPAFSRALQFAGAAYLIHVAVRMWRAPSRPAAQPGRLSRRRALLAGLLTNLSNPKAALFFGSIFTAVLPGRPGGALLIASIALVLANAMAWHLFLALFFSRRRVQVALAARRVAFSRVAGAMVGAYGVSLLVAGLIDP
jgi:threonine/homoserine/homoserine lactone efflux protein